MSVQAKKVSESITIITKIVLPNDTNTYNNLMGGQLMYWMDIAAATTALKHCNAPCVTASVDNISFKTPIKLGNIVHIEAHITRAFHSSMEVYLKVFGEDALQQHKYEGNEAFFTFVALGNDGKPTKIPEVIAETVSEKKLYDGALHRRQLRLILAGKLKPTDADELKTIFFPDNSIQ
jgi:acyl-CoA hydrolase